MIPERSGTDFIDAVQKFLDRADHVDGLDQMSAQARRARQIEATYTSAVAFLRDSFPNDEVRKLATQLWRSVESKKTPTAMTDVVKTVHFLALARGLLWQALVLIPENWYEMVRRDPLAQLGAVVWAGSQAVDFANHKIRESQDADALARAGAYEAEYLLTIRRTSPHWEPHAYQSAVIERYPEGTRTEHVRDLVYY